MEKIEIIMVKAREIKGTYVYEELLGESAKPPVFRTQYIQKWALGSDPPDRIKVTRDLPNGSQKTTNFYV